MNIAIVRSAEELHVYDRDRELSRRFTEAAATDSRFKDIKVTALAWDEENDWGQFTHILLSAGLEYYKCHTQVLDWLDGLPEHMRSRVFNQPQLIKWNMNKIYLVELKDKGIELPATVFLPAGDKKMEKDIDKIVHDLEKQTQQPLQGIVIKNMMDAGGHSVHRVKFDGRQENNGQDILNQAITSYEAGVIVQEYLTSISTEGEWSVVYIDRKASHAVVKRPCASGFKIQPEYGGSTDFVELENVPKDVLELSNRVIELAPEQKLLYARVDSVRGNDGKPKLMELEVFEPELYLFFKTELSLKFLEAMEKY